MAWGCYCYSPSLLVQVPARGRDMRKRKPPPWTFSGKISEGLHSEIFDVNDLERLAMSD